MENINIQEGGASKIFLACFAIIGIIFIVLFGIFMIAPGSNDKAFIWIAYAISIVLLFASVGLAFKNQPIFATVSACGTGVALWTAYIWTIGAKNLPENDKSRPYAFLGGAVIAGAAMAFCMQKSIKVGII
jgi:hypothetical protein